MLAVAILASLGTCLNAVALAGCLLPLHHVQDLESHLCGTAILARFASAGLWVELEVRFAMCALGLGAVGVGGAAVLALSTEAVVCFAATVPTFSELSDGDPHAGLLSYILLLLGQTSDTCLKACSRCLSVTCRPKKVSWQNWMISLAAGFS